MCSIRVVFVVCYVLCFLLCCSGVCCDCVMWCARCVFCVRCAFRVVLLFCMCDVFVLCLSRDRVFVWGYLFVMVLCSWCVVFVLRVCLRVVAVLA